MNDLMGINEYDFYPLDEESLQLTQQQITKASEASELVTNNELKWQVYLNMLGLAGFENWLEDRSDNLRVDDSKCSLLSTPSIAAAEGLQVREFKICTVAVGSIDEDFISVPKSILIDSSKAAHFYVFIQVLEEIAQTSILGFIRYDQLKAKMESEPLEQFSDGTCDLAREWLTSDSDELLLYLRCLDSSVIVLPEVELIKQVEKKGVADGLNLIKEVVIDTSQWLNNTLDRVSESLMARLLPNTLEFSPLRSNPLGFKEILDAVKNDGRIEIPDSVSKVTYPIEGGFALNILVWKIPNSQDEWSLLSIITSIQEQNLPLQLSLKIHDDAKLIDIQTVTKEFTPYLYICAIGDYSESFKVSVSNAEDKTLSSLTFILKPDSGES